MNLYDLQQNPQMATELFKRVAGVLVGLLVCVVLAYWVGSGETFLLAVCAALVVVAFVTAGLREKAWVLIPFGWTFSGNTYVLPFGLSVRDVTIMLGFCAYIGYRIVTGRSRRHKWTLLDGLVILNAAYVVITFVLHPVGFRVSGSETYGGRNYFNIALALVGFWVLVKLPRSVKNTSRIPYFLLAGALIVAILNLIVYLAPSTTPYLLRFYGGVDYTSFVSSIVTAPRLTRWAQLYPFGMTLTFVLCAKYPPRVLFNPLRWPFYFGLLAFVTILATGFRNVLLWAIAALFISAVFHRGLREVVAAAILGGLLLLFAVLGHGRFYDLPMAAQRTLSFMPGDWAAEVKTDAQSSSEARFDWWEKIIKYRMIRDWWFGDGFGVAERDYLLTAGSGTRVEEHFMLTGAYHNGPLSTIRFAGVCGLTLLYALMIVSAVEAAKCVNRCRDTILFPAALFVAIQLIWTPVHFTFVFGGYDSQLPLQFFLIGLLRLIMRMAEELPETETEPAAVPAAPVRALA